jgi:Trypsin-like peptidase domain
VNADKNRETSVHGDAADQKKWEVEVGFREREVRVLEREQTTKEKDIELKEKEFRQPGWKNPLVVAILAATVAAAGNAAVAFLNGIQQRNLERERAEEARILEVLKTGDPDKAAENLTFLLDAGLISNDQTRRQLSQFIEKREPGTGPALAAATSASQSVVNDDDAVPVGALPADDSLRVAARSVGRLTTSYGAAWAPTCTSFLVAKDLALTSGSCLQGTTSARLEMDDGKGGIETFSVVLPPIELNTNYALVRLAGNPGQKYGVLYLAGRAPIENEPLSIVMYRSGNTKLAVTKAPDCRVVSVADEAFQHRCDTGRGSSGAPVMSLGGKEVLGLHYRRSGEAFRMDAIIQASSAL